MYSNSSAYNAGIRGANEMALLYNQRILVGGDIITEIDGKPIASPKELDLMLEGKRPGDTVQVTFTAAGRKA